MPLRRMVRNFVDPVDARTAATLTRQVAELEDNVSNECDDIRATKQPTLVPIQLAVRSSGLQLEPGQSAGFDTAAGSLRVLLARPSAKSAGKLLAIWKLTAPNSLTIEAPSGVSINRASTLVRSAVGLQIIFCDGVEYWA